MISKLAFIQTLTGGKVLEWVGRKVNVLALAENSSMTAQMLPIDFSRAERDQALQLARQIADQTGKTVYVVNMPSGVRRVQEKTKA